MKNEDVNQEISILLNAFYRRCFGEDYVRYEPKSNKE